MEEKCEPECYVAEEPEKVQPAPAEEPPNGGVRAWLQVLGSYILFLNTWGVVNSYGVFQTYYAVDMLRHETHSNISWVGSIQAFLLMIIGTASGPLFDAGYFDALLRTGAFLVTFGMFMTSLCTQYWQVMLAQGITVGLGSGCLFVPSMAILPTYFTTKNAFATGIAVSGSSLGGVIYPIIFARLQPQMGFVWATRIIAFIILATMLVCVGVMSVRVLPLRKRRFLELNAFKEVPFLTFSIAQFLGFMGLYIPSFYVQSFAIENSIMTSHLAFYMLSIVNATSAFGRVVPNFFADKIGPLNTLAPCTTMASLLAFCWIAVDSTAGVIVFCIMYGFFSGTFFSLIPPTVVNLSPDLSVVGTRLGMTSSFAAFGVLVGNPVAGAILNSGGWLGLQTYCGICVGTAAVACVIARLAHAPALLSRA